MPFPLLNLAGLATMLALFTVAGCSPDAAPKGCDGALGVHRTLSLTGDMPPLFDLLEENEVVLSFDDGPHFSGTERVLDLLDGECTQATFFLVGREAERHPKIVAEILARGHTIGGHTWSHPDLSKMTIDDALVDITKGNQAIAAAAGRSVTFFRFPFIATTPDLHAAIRANSLIDVTVTADGEDWTNLTPERSVETLMKKLEAGQRRGIVLLHDPYPRSDERTRILLKSLKSEGYRVVAITD